MVADVYPAGEQPIEGISRDRLIEGLRSHGHRHVESLNAEHQLAEIVSSNAISGDMVVCLGAGNITHWANELPNQLDKLRSSQCESD